MEQMSWSWAQLDAAKLKDLVEAEKTLGADILLAYQSVQNPNVKINQFGGDGLHVSPLNPSQVECLNGLESKIRAVVIAYQKTA